MAQTASQSAARARECDDAAPEAAPAAPSLPPDFAAAQTPPQEQDAASVEDQKRAFLRLVSHELRTPLNSILGFSELLSTELLGPLGAPQYKEYAEIIRKSGKRLLNLVNQVLEIGRLQGLELELRPEPVEVALEEVAASLAEDFASRQATSRIIAETPEAQAMADPWGLRTVLTHVIHNAVAFSPEGGEVRLIVRRTGAFLDIFVEDDGEGIDPAELPRLMKPFEQGEAALVRRSEGAGLGLTIAELTCQAMGTRLSVRPAPGGGASVRVRLMAA